MVVESRMQSIELSAGEKAKRKADQAMSLERLTQVPKKKPQPIESTYKIPEKKEAIKRQLTSKIEKSKRVVAEPEIDW